MKISSLNTKIPKELTSSRYRKEMWKETVKVLKSLDKTLPIAQAYILGSFVTAKRRPADVDFILLLKLKGTNPKIKWSVDLVLAPDNSHGEYILEDANKWMKQKYGSRKFMMLKLK